MSTDTGLIDGCPLAYRCPKHWSDLAVIAGQESVRWCPDCREPVFFVESKGELKRLAEARRCVAFVSSGSTGEKGVQGGKILMGDPVGDDIPY